jgi:hypothetical protein
VTGTCMGGGGGAMGFWSVVSVRFAWRHVLIRLSSLCPWIEFDFHCMPTIIYMKPSLYVAEHSFGAFTSAASLMLQTLLYCDDAILDLLLSLTVFSRAISLHE